MNMSQKISYNVELTKDDINLVSKALMGVLKERELESARELGLQILESVNKLSEERLQITQGALNRASEL